MARISSSSVSERRWVLARRAAQRGRDLRAARVVAAELGGAVGVGDERGRGASVMITRPRAELGDRAHDPAQLGGLAELAGGGGGRDLGLAQRPATAPRASTRSRRLSASGTSSATIASSRT